MDAEGLLPYHWQNEPTFWSGTSTDLYVLADPLTDFWWPPEGEEPRSSGHFRWTAVKGDFVCKVSIESDVANQSDHCGLMVRASPDSWLKAGLELVDGVVHFTLVETAGQSRMSLRETPPGTRNVDLRIVSRSRAVRVLYRVPGMDRYDVGGLVVLPGSNCLNVGMMCASPKGPGFVSQFSNWSLRSGVDL